MESVLGGSSSNSGNIFTLQKIIRIVADVQLRTSSKDLFRELEILSVPRQYVCFLVNFIIDNQEGFQTNSFVYNINTRNKHNLQ
jgi:hypothetical protein